MGNIITYVLENGHLAFDELGFNEVDSLILSELSYLDYSCCGDSAVMFSTTIGTLRERGFIADNPSNNMSPDECTELFDAMENSRRFRDVGVDFFASETDLAEEKQFAAVTFRLSPRLHYIAYRGTDSSLVGWKEDLNMSYRADIPAQLSAVRYFEDIAGQMRSNYILGGHSKGGNLAVYAAMSAQPKFRQHIALVYDHDGPGFREETLERPGFRAIEKRIYKTVPESAVVGLLLTEHEKYTVVASDAVSLLQHDPFSWRVEGTDFVTAPDTDILSKVTDRTMTHWLSQTDDATREAFVNALFALIQVTGAQTLPELTENWQRNLKSVVAATREMDPTARKMILTLVAQLIRASGRGLRETIEDEINQLLEEMRISGRELRETIEGEINQSLEEFRNGLTGRLQKFKKPQE